MSAARVGSKAIVNDGQNMTTIHINGQAHEATDPSRNLLSFIRFEAGLTGTKYGCGEGLCGACTVIVDGQPLRSCMATVGAVSGGSITTIEGLARDGELHPVQQAFIDESAMQCGYCIPGFVMTAAALLARDARPGEGQIREALSQNMCRCGTYQRILRAVDRASKTMAGGAR
jgi:aerobic-type carbon monoxide dehydrogenase small subunit (CoxS/CutS family)